MCYRAFTTKAVFTNWCLVRGKLQLGGLIFLIDGFLAKYFYLKTPSLPIGK